MSNGLRFDVPPAARTKPGPHTPDACALLLPAQPYSPLAEAAAPRSPLRERSPTPQRPARTATAPSVAKPKAPHAAVVAHEKHLTRLAKARKDKQGADAPADQVRHSRKGVPMAMPVAMPR